MSTRVNVKDYQHRLGRLAAAHDKAQTHLEATMAKRAEVLVEQDRLVTAAEGAVRKTVIDMTAGVGAELTAAVLGVDLAEVRRLGKGAERSGSSQP